MHCNKYKWVARWQTKMCCWLPPQKNNHKETIEARVESGFQKLTEKQEKILGGLGNGSMT